MRVLITGGAGFIGSHLADAYLAAGYEVHILDNFSTGSKKNIAHIEDQVRIIDGDIRDENLVSEALRDSDLVLHFAAALGVKNIMENPIDSISTNFHGSEVILNEAANQQKRIIIASTSEIYGKNPNQPLTEESDRVIGKPQNIRWSYSDAKALEESLAQALHDQKQLPVSTIRLFNTVGPRQTGYYGMVIPRFVEAAKQNKPLTIHGDGTQSRVFCHVKDAVEAITKISTELKSIGQVYNIGGQGEITIKELASKITERTKSTSTIEFKSYEAAYGKGFEDMYRRVPDITKVTSTIGWSPKLNIDQIIDDVANA